MYVLINLLAQTSHSRYRQALLVTEQTTAVMMSFTYWEERTPSWWSFLACKWSVWYHHVRVGSKELRMQICNGVTQVCCIFTFCLVTVSRLQSLCRWCPADRRQSLALHNFQAQGGPCGYAWVDLWCLHDLTCGWRVRVSSQLCGPVDTFTWYPSWFCAALAFYVESVNGPFNFLLFEQIVQSQTLTLCILPACYQKTSKL